MNKAIFKGRLTRDPEIRFSNSSEPVCLAKFSIACEDRDRGKNEEGNHPANFIPCVCMGKLAEIAEKNLCKGKEILIYGKMQSGSYTNSESRTIYYLECFVKEIEFCGKKDDSTMPDGNPFMNIPEGFDGLPFK